MTESVSNNPCIELGCNAACCRNIIGHVVCRKERFLRIFPSAIPVTEQEDLTRKVKDQNQGVYYYTSGEYIYFSVSGNCPNLKDNSCNVHGSRDYLPPCINMIPGKDQCQRSRRLDKTNLFDNV